MNNPVSLHDWLQIEQAACGCISGTLREWPDLARAFKKMGMTVKRGTTAANLKKISLALLERRSRISIQDGIK